MSRLVRILFPFSCCFFMLALLCAACVTSMQSPAASSGSAQSSVPPGHGSAPDAPPEPSVPGSSESPPDSPVSGDPEPPPDSSDPGGGQKDDPAPAPDYDFTQPVPESEAVDKEYFADAAFLGDSRTEGFLLYSGIGRGKNLTASGANIFRLSENKAITIGGEKYTLLEALALEQYAKVYICLGVNELGYNNDEGFYQAYCDAIDAIRACQPDAVIYVQSLIPLNEDVIAATGGKKYLTNEHLRRYNELIRRAAEEKQVAFLDVYAAFEEDGILPAEASSDGVHLTGAYCRRWLEYLMTHTVDFDTLYPGGVSEAEEVPET